MLKAHIEQLNTEMQLEQSLQERSDHAFTLFLEPDLEIALEQNGGGRIYFATKCAPLPAVEPEVFCQKMMIANLFGRETGGFVLGLDPGKKQVTLVGYLPEEASYTEFYERLEDFANYAESWRRETRAAGTE